LAILSSFVTSLVRTTSLNVPPVSTATRYVMPSLPEPQA
jgi:hypothetical protein